jgi:hypothetical protein
MPGAFVVDAPTLRGDATCVWLAHSWEKNAMMRSRLV